jgi:hypothetical protein
MNDKATPMKEPSKPHGDKIDPNDPTDGPEAQRLREKRQHQDKAEGERKDALGFRPDDESQWG